MDPDDATTRDDRGAEPIVVWLIDLDGASPSAVQVAALSDAERAAIARARTAALRHRRTVALAARRAILAPLLGVHPAEVSYAVGAHGTPSLAAPLADRWHFNASDTGGLGALAVGRHGPLGLDLEHRVVTPDLAAVADRVFAPDELAAWCANHHSAGDVFFRIWTRKEAYLKALGIGLPEDLREVAVSPSAEDPAIVKRWHEDPTTWHVDDVSPAPDIAGALVQPASGARPMLLKRWGD